MPASEAIVLTGRRVKPETALTPGTRPIDIALVSAL
jgi:hypothetical protein